MKIKKSKKNRIKVVTEFSTLEVEERPQANYFTIYDGYVFIDIPKELIIELANYLCYKDDKMTLSGIVGEL